MTTTLRQLATRLRELDPLLAQYVTDRSTPALPALSDLQSAQLRDCVKERRDHYELILEAVYEGYLLHYRCGRIVAIDDRDFAVLAGDRLYALALTLVTEHGDVYGVSVLARLISRLAHAEVDYSPEHVTAAWERATCELLHAVCETDSQPHCVDS